MEIKSTDVAALAPLVAPAATGAAIREGTAAPDTGRTRVPDQSPSEVARDDAPAPTAEQIKLPEFRETELSFRIEQGLNRVVVQVIDAKTKTVLRSIPPEELLRLAKHF